MDTFNITSRAQEPNPFEESFSTTIAAPPMPLKAESSIFSSICDSQNLSDFSTGTSSGDSLQYNTPQQETLQSQYPALQQTLNTDAAKPTLTTGIIRRKTRKVKAPKDEEKRKNFLERNRIAALKCRQRKKQWLLNLQARVEFLTNDNDQLQLEAEALRKEIMDLKTLLVAHKDCSNYNNDNSTSAAMSFYQHQHHSLTAMPATATRTKADPIAYGGLLPTTTAATASAATAAAAALYHATTHATANPRFF